MNHAPTSSSEARRRFCSSALRLAGQTRHSPLSFDWSWLYWYFVRFAEGGSPFGHSGAFDIKTAYAVKARIPVAKAGLARIPDHLRSSRPHTHHALDDAIEQAEIFANVMEWSSSHG